MTCLCLQHKALSPPQRAASNAETKVSRRAGGAAGGTPPSCPMHGLRSDLLKELEAKTGPGKFPLLTALCSDASLQSRCTCHADAAVATDTKRLSLSPAAADVTTQHETPGSSSRPLSWHSEHFTLDNHLMPSLQTPSLRVYNAATPDIAMLPLRSMASTSEVSGAYVPASDMAWMGPATGRLRQSLDSLDIGLEYPTMLTFPNGRVPPAPHVTGSNLTGTHSLDDLLKPHYYSLGMAS